MTAIDTHAPDAAPDQHDHDRPTPGDERRSGLRLHRGNTVMIIVGHALCLAAPFVFSWSGLAWCLVLFWFSSGIGITLGWHRLLTHRSFRTPRWVELALTVVGCLSLQHGPIEWVGTHRMHHAHTDGDEDPHSPTHGFFWSHVRWTFFKTEPDPRQFAKDLVRDRTIARIDRVYWLFPLLLAAVLLVAGEFIRPGLGISWVVWGVALRTVLVFHAIWFVNSAAHTWGYKNFEDASDDSRNNWWVAIIAFGEGWHNNHHADPRCAAHGRRWWEFDPTWTTIRLMRRVGLAWDVKDPGPLPERRVRATP
ncbi:MAG: fatty acid desaturase [Phycisphaerales bacterium]|jgi:fatty-acid desaturase